MGKWLVDLGRDYALRPQAGETIADTEMMLTFMQAATRVEPTLAEAYRRQYELLWAIGRTAEAAEALARYAALAPEDRIAGLLLLAARTDDLQTMEERACLWRDWLEKKDLSAELASDLHRRIAEYHYNRRELPQATSHAREAIRLLPENVAARRLLYELEGRSNEPLAQLDIALEMVRLNAGNPVLLWDVARLLDSVGLHEQAETWYRRALIAFDREAPSQPPPAEFLLSMAASRIDAGKPDPAEAILQRLPAPADRSPAAYRLLARVARLRNEAEKAEGLLAQARAEYEARWNRPQSGDDRDLAAEMAWFYTIELPDAARARELSAAAMAHAAPGPLARLAYGFSLLAEKRWEEARRVLEPLANEDPWAALGLADAQAGAGDTKGAIERLASLAQRHPTGLLHEQIGARFASWQVQMPPPADRRDLLERLNAFDARVIQYASDPGRYLDVQISPLTGSSGGLGPGEPIRVRVAVKNKGPFPIALGENLMVRPIVLVLADSTGDRARSHGDVARIDLYQRQMLQPGESLTAEQTLDVGSLRATLISTPQVAQRITFRAILGPRYAEDRRRWVPQIGGIETGPVEVTRIADRPEPDRLAAAIGSARSGPVARRIEALERLAMWLAEDGHLRAGRITYAGPHVPADAKAIRSIIREALSDPAWEVRAHLAEALRWIVLDAEFAGAASVLLNDPSPIVRMLAVRLFADQHGAAFAGVASRLAESDPDALVRQMAKAVGQRWVAPTTRKAGAGAD